MSQTLAILWITIALILQLAMAPGILNVPFGLIAMVLSGWGASLVYRSQLGLNEPYPIVRRFIIGALALICMVQPLGIYCHFALRDWMAFTKTIQGELRAGLTESEIIQFLGERGRVVRHDNRDAKKKQQITIAPKWPLFFGDHLVVSLAFNKEGKMESSYVSTHD